MNEMPNISPNFFQSREVNKKNVCPKTKTIEPMKNHTTTFFFSKKKKKKRIKESREFNMQFRKTKP
jgi:hypothetical protein